MRSLYGEATAAATLDHPIQQNHEALSRWAISPIRRAVDFCIAAVALVISFPWLVIIGFAVRLSSRGPALFRQRRMGRFGQDFTLYKFRSMIAGSETGPSITVNGDSRVTPVGAVLRRWKLDELPQLWNVLKGDMSLVGPRPKLAHHEPLSLICRPGISGAATLAFRNEEQLLWGIPAAELEEIYEQCVKPAKMQLDCEYMQSASFTSDCALLVETALSCLFPNLRSSAVSAEYIDKCARDCGLPITRKLNDTSTSDHQFKSPQARKACRAELLVLLVPMALAVHAPAQNAVKTQSAAREHSQVDMFAGSTWWGARGSIEGAPFYGSNTGINVNGTWYFNHFHRSLGVELDGKYYYNESNDSLVTVSAGPVLRFPASHGLTPFIHVLGRAADIQPPPVEHFLGKPTAGYISVPAAWGPQFTLGQGLDYDLPWFHRRFALRIYQVDYMFDHVNFGRNGTEALSSNLNSVTLSTGLVLHLESFRFLHHRRPAPSKPR